MVTAAQLRATFAQAHSSKQSRAINTTTYAIQNIVGQTLRRYVAAGANPERYSSFLFANVAGSQVTAAHAARDLTVLENCTFGNAAGDHLLARTDVAWRQMYHHAQRPFVIRQPGLGGEHPVQRWSFPCHYCGIAVPDELLQVDHQMPQNGAPGAAILKSLHSLNRGYTTAAAHGTKNTQIAHIATSNLGMLATVSVKGYAFGTKVWNTPNLPLGGAKGQRYSLSPSGVTLLAIAIMHYGQLRFSRECINSFLNLVPSCASCNGAAGKGSKLHPY